MNTSKAKALLLIAVLGATSTAAASVTLHGEAGEKYTNLAFSTSADQPGVTFSGNWAHSDDNGDIAGIGLGYNFNLGPFLLTAGGRWVYLNPQNGDEGYAVALGGGAQLPLGDHFALFADGYYSPDSLSSGVNDYVEASAGARLKILKSMSIEAGYRYIEMAGKNGDSDSTLADGAYAGLNFTF